MKPQVICVPGSVAPAAVRYKPLLEAVGDAADLHPKDLEVYREAAPPAGYRIEEELDAIDRLADSTRMERFHLVAYSGGGFVALAYTATRPERVTSLALFEPARIPGELTEGERAFYSGLESNLSGLKGSEFMATFVRMQVKPGVQTTPPPTSASPEMQKRPAGIAALISAFEAYHFDRQMLAATACPVFYAYGDLSHEEQALKAGILAQLFADVYIRRYAGIHHFVPAEMIYTPEHARTLLEHWHRAEALAP